MMRGQKRRDTGQSVAEFALVLTPLLLVILGIIQFGFIFNAYVTVANATREGTRAGSIWVPDPNATQAANDGDREAYVEAGVRSTMGLLQTTAPHLDGSDIDVTYWDSDASCPRGDPIIDADVRRKGHYVCVTVTYHLDLFIPFISELLPRDGAGRMNIVASSYMVIN